MTHHVRRIAPAAKLRRLATASIAGALAVGAAGFIGAGGPAFGQTSPGAGSAVLSYLVSVQAPILQITEDEPNATFHPEGEGDWGYSFASLDPAGQHALASVVWPGAAAGNAGTLVEVLTGNSSLTALNDPVRAEATSGTPQTQQNTSAPTGTTMSATVQPPVPGDQYAAANSSLGGGGLGAAGTVGASTSASTIHFDSSTGALTATAQSAASGISIDGGLITIGSLTSSAQGTSDNGAQPQMTGSTLIHNMTIAGQSAYVDGSGVHLGQPGSPAAPPVQDAVNSALQQAGMQIYSTVPSKVTIGQVDYFDASSLLFYWAPPGDSSHNSFTASVGGAAVSMTAASSAFQGGLSSANASSDNTGSFTPAATPATSPDTGTAAAPQLSLPTNATPALSSQPQIAPPTRSQVNPPTATLASASLPGGLGVGWIILIALAGLLGAVGLTRVPALMASSTAAGAAGCPNPRRLRDGGGSSP
ncbi:MAG TPA: hypothetical protein VFZ97_14875 [Acidimicrobiales bacterium]